jgi:hypothetical protein
MPREGVIVLDDQQHAIAGLDALAIVVERVVVDGDVVGGEGAIDRRGASRPALRRRARPADSVDT